MTLILPRRKFLLGLVGVLAAPAVVKFENLMPVRALMLPPPIVMTYQWLRNGLPIPGETRPTLYNWTLPETIQGVMRQSSDVITCDVTAVLA